MATNKQRKNPSGRVVSVRLPEEIIERLDALSERTGRSRGVYLRMMIRDVLPIIEEHHWAQVTAHYEEDELERNFRQIIAGLSTAADDEQEQP